MKTSRVIGVGCLLGAALASGAWAQEPAARRADAAGAARRDGTERKDRQERLERFGAGGAGAGIMGGEFGGEMKETMIAHFINNPEVAEKLGLTSDQTKALGDKLTEIRKEQIRLRAEQEIAAMEQVRLLSQDAVDEKAVMSAVEKTAKINGDLAKAQVRPIIEIKKALTPEQLKQARAMIRERVEKRRQDGGEGPWLRGGPEEGRETRADMPPPPPQQPGPEGEASREGAR